MRSLPARTALTLLVACLMLVPAQGIATKKPVQHLAGDTIVSATGSAAVALELTQPVVVDYNNPLSWWTSFETDGSHAAVMIQELSPHPYEKGQALFYMRLQPPHGCRQAEEVCDPVDLAWWSVFGDESGPDPLMTLEVGTYLVYALTDPGRSVTARFRLEGLSGQTSVHARTPVDAQMRSDYTYTTDSRLVEVVGKMAGSLSGKGVLMAFNWQTQGVFNAWALRCFERPSDEDDPLTTCGYPLRRPEVYSGGNGATFELFEAGQWVVGYRVEAAGDFSPRPGGQVGVAALWLTFA